MDLGQALSADVAHPLAATPAAVAPASGLGFRLVTWVKSASLKPW